MYKQNLSTTYYPTKTSEISILNTRKSNYKILGNYVKSRDFINLDLLLHICKVKHTIGNSPRGFLNSISTPHFYIMTQPKFSTVTFLNHEGEIKQRVIWKE
jgi:hypothetical protein